MKAIIALLVVASFAAVVQPERLDEDYNEIQDGKYEDIPSDDMPERDGELFENDVEDKFEKIDSEEEQDYIEDSGDGDDDDDYDLENSFENDAKAECKRTSQGAEYRGTIHKTKSGLTCQRWDSQSPHKHATNTPQRNPSAGLDQNFCRNPDGEHAPWCYTTSSRKRWEICNVPMCVSEKPKGRVECLKSSRGADYRGTASKTKSGFTCQRWDSQSPQRHSTNTPQRNPTAGLEQNFCRNPDNEAKPWCYTTSSSKRWEVCDIKLCPEEKPSGRVECKKTTKGVEYRGTISKTKSGLNCQRWDSQSPHRHHNTPERKPKKGLEQNFCRNPDNEATPWCYTTSPSKRWEACNIPVCVPDINGGYTAWSQWSACDKKCGSGFKHRKRSCTNPKPSGKGKDCSSLGSAAQKMACKIKDCKKYPTVTAPKVSPALNGKNIVFKCEFGIDAKDSGAVYEITWYQGNKLISTGQASSLSGAKRTATLQNTNNNVFRLGATISCKVRSWFSSTSNLKHGYVESNRFFAGIKVSQTSITIRECGKPVKITLTATVPIASNVVVNLNQNNEQIVISTCGVVFGPGAAGQTKTFDVIAKKDFVNDGNQRTSINIFVTSTTGHIDWSGYSQVGIQVTTVDVKTAQCTSFGDPHFKTFDGRTYNHFRVGDYVLVKSSCRKFEVHARTWRCARVSCNCGVAIREGDDVVIVDMCKDRIPRVRFASKKEPAPGVSVKRDPSGKSFFISMPSGASVKTTSRHWFGSNYYMDLTIKASCSEYKCSSGLCGTFDGNNRNEFKARNGRLSHGASFTESWKIPQGRSLFYYKGGSKTCNKKASGKTYCMCKGGRNSKTVNSCQKRPVMTKPAFATGTNSWRTCESPRRAECDRIRKEKEQEENAIILPDDDKDGKYQYHPKPNPNVVFKWPTKSGRTKADCERICRNAIRNSAPGKICSKVTELSFAPYIALCVVDLKITDDPRFAAASIGAMQSACSDILLNNKKYWKKDKNGVLQPPIDFGNTLCPNLCSGRGRCVKGKCICNAKYTSADCSVKKGVPPTVRSEKDYCDVRRRGDCQFVRIDGNNFFESSKLSCRATQKKISSFRNALDGTRQILDGDLLSFAEIKCSFRRNPIQIDGNPNKSKGTPVARFIIEASNDKRTYSKGKVTYIIYDSKCIACNRRRGTCNLKRNKCLINGYCFNAGEKNPNNAKDVCAPSQSTTSFYSKDHGSVVSSGKSSSQSSTGWGGVPSRAVDGNKNSQWGGKSCTHTNRQHNAWWRIDLGGNYLVRKVQVTNRGDCCWNRLSNFDIRVGNTDGNPKANQVCKHFNGAVGKGATRNVVCARRVTGRYVYVMLRGTNWLTLCEVVVFGKRLGNTVPVKTGKGNIARGKNTRQSSTGWGGSSSRAVDGNRNSQWGGRSCTHTHRQHNAWWRVDLGADYKVGMVKVTNRGDCCGNRLSNFDIRVGNTDGNPKANPVCNYHRGAVRQGATVSLSCRGNNHGRYVYVMLRGTNYLTLCEVEVYSKKPVFDYGSVVSSGKSASQSSTGWGGVPSRAVDGNKNSQWGGKSCTHTNRQHNAWWRVDLGGNYLVRKVQVTNRGDCCWNRLSNFDIRVGNTDGNPKANQVCKHFNGAVGKGATRNVVCARRVTGRYVYVMLRGTNWLTLCEVVVFGKRLGNVSPIKTGRGNLARGKGTRQSSTAHGGSSSRAVDGNRNSQWGGRSCTHTQSQHNAWWRVDLGADYRVGTVKLTNRGDCCGNRLSNFDIRVGNRDGNPKANALCKHYGGTVRQGGSVSLPCRRNNHGRYVYVMLRGRNYLTLCEVEVYSEGAHHSTSICEHRSRRLRCPRGRVMSILSANYGRLNRQTCPSSSIRTTNCRARISLSKVRASCQGKSTCILRASNSVFGDPCYGTFKYLHVSYKCHKPGNSGNNGPIRTGRGNLARGRGTRQSSTAYGGSSSRAVDGNRNSRWGGRSCTHTHSQHNAWWRVDLGADYRVGTVKLTNRGDCCGNRLSNFDIRVGNRDGNPKANALCKHYGGTVRQGGSVSLHCRRNNHGRYVYVMLRGRNYLTLCEVQVYSQGGNSGNTRPMLMGWGNLARGKGTRQSSTAYGGSSSRAVDGNRNTRWGGRSCTHTNAQHNAWWRVDLGADYKVERVKLTNRGDCCGNRLSNFDIRVGNRDGNPKANALCKYYGGAVRQGGTVQLRCRRNSHGRYVYVMLRGRNYLTLCEVEVYS